MTATTQRHIHLFLEPAARTGLLIHVLEFAKGYDAIIGDSRKKFK
jgi:hypothetical protein